MGEDDFVAKFKDAWLKQPIADVTKGAEPEDPFPPLNKPKNKPVSLTGNYRTCLGCGWHGPQDIFEDHCWSVHRVTSSLRDGAAAQKILNDGRELTLYPTLFGARFLIGPVGDMGGDEEFMFDSFDAAEKAMMLWQGYGQPEHWTRWKVGNKEYVRWTDGQPISKEDRDTALAAEAVQRAQGGGP